MMEEKRELFTVFLMMLTLMALGKVQTATLRPPVLKPLASEFRSAGFPGSGQRCRRCFCSTPLGPTLATQPLGSWEKLWP